MPSRSFTIIFVTSPLSNPMKNISMIALAIMATVTIVQAQSHRDAEGGSSSGFDMVSLGIGLVVGLVLGFLIGSKMGKK